jgi:heme-degrading monooxygenase HmoA
MAYVAINVLTVPPGRGETLEQRFAGRAGSVEHSPGFERFELLRPVEGTDAYLVYTRWRSRADFEAWTASQSFERGHAQPQAGSRPQADAQPQAGSRPQADAQPEAARPAASAATLWAFEVVQLADAGTGTGDPDVG